MVLVFALLGDPGRKARAEISADFLLFRLAAGTTDLRHYGPESQDSTLSGFCLIHLTAL